MFKMAAKKQKKKKIFRFAKIVTWPKFEKPLSRWNFFNEIWLKVGEHEYIYILK